MSQESYVNQQNISIERFRSKFAAVAGGAALLASGCSVERMCEYAETAEYAAQPGDGVDDAIFAHNDSEKLQGSKPRHLAREAFYDLNPDTQGGLMLDEVYDVPKCDL